MAIQKKMFWDNQVDQLLSDTKKCFVCEVYFSQKKYIFDPERSTNCATSSFSVKIVCELSHFLPLIFVQYCINFTYNMYKRLKSCRHHSTFLLTNSQQNFNGVFFCEILKNHQISSFCSQRRIFKTNLWPKKESSIRKYGKSPKEVSFSERSIAGHPG